MAIRHWHPIKLSIIWLIDLTLLFVFWLLASPHKSDQALATATWLFLSIPAFVITWKWASGLEKPGDLSQVEQSEIPPAKGAIFNRTRTASVNILLSIIVGMVSGVGGYYYKQSEIYAFSEAWIKIPDNADDPNDTVKFSPEHSKSLPLNKYIHIPFIETTVRFAKARFDRNGDAELLYRIKLKAELFEGINLDHPESMGRNKAVKSINGCEFYLNFELFDKDDFFLVGLVGPRDSFTVGDGRSFEGVVEETIPAQMAQRTTKIHRQVVLDECH